MPRAPKAPGHRDPNQHRWDTSQRSRQLPADWQSRRLRVLERDRRQCQIRDEGCTGTATEVDHRVPYWQGGHDELDNLQSACHSCHHRKTSREGAAARKATGGYASD